MQKTFRRIYWKGKLLGEYAENERDEFNRLMHQIMLRIGKTPEEGLVMVVTILALVEANM